jgi:hypothetical protein
MVIRDWATKNNNKFCVGLRYGNIYQYTGIIISGHQLNNAGLYQPLFGTGQQG